MHAASSFLYIGRLAEDTGILPFARCLANAAAETSSRPLLTVVGDGPLRAEIVAAAGDRCELVFHPATADVDGFLASAGVVVATGFLAVLDAFAFERPVIAPALTAIKRDYFSSIPNARELLFLAADEEELQRTLCTLLRSGDADGVRMRVARAKAFVDTLSWTGIANSHLDAYERAAA
jgi:glycosyltransferase involved in cell wall biosynthesis